MKLIPVRTVPSSREFLNNVYRILSGKTIVEIRCDTERLSTLPVLAEKMIILHQMANEANSPSEIFHAWTWQEIIHVYNRLIVNHGVCFKDIDPGWTQYSLDGETLIKQMLTPIGRLAVNPLIELENTLKIRVDRKLARQEAELLGPFFAVLERSYITAIVLEPHQAFKLIQAREQMLDKKISEEKSKQLLVAEAN